MAIPIHQVIESIKKSHGIIQLAADMLGVNREALSKRIHRSKVLKRALHVARETRLDFAESKIIKHMNSKTETISLSATKYFLSTQGKERGYYTKIEKEENINVPIVIEYKRRKNEKTT